MDKEKWMRETSASARALAELISRRELFSRSAAGFAGVALSALLAQDRARGEALPLTPGPSPARGEGSNGVTGTHFAPRAKAVIQLFQHGGPRHMDLLDPKPELNVQNGKPMPAYFTDLVKLTAHGNLLGTPYKFAKMGQCGVEWSEILPHTRELADDIAVVRSMHCEHNN